MSAVLHVLILSLKGLVVYAAVIAVIVGSILTIFGAPTGKSYEPPNTDILTGLIGGGALLLLTMLCAVAVLIGKVQS